MAVYLCNRCGFLFERVSEVTACEDCGSSNIRLAGEKEIDEFERYKAEFNVLATKQRLKDGSRQSETFTVKGI